ncbi:MAG: ATP phosphoribosyltransferase [Nanoarchaeota archaeon]|nr:ATP phosphoribosyltransferase [Nanoarchaeota archaeon]MBU1704896.1 ATP phosphoribosyltransferase [Nanoarchaeota archaeon]
MKLGIPKGSLQDTTIELMKKAGFNIKINGRSYYPVIDDPEIECILIRAQEMSRYVEQGIIDAGITGKDWIIENSSDVVEVLDMIYSKSGLGKVRWILAAPKDGKIKSVQDLEGKKIATEAVNIAKDYFKRNNVNATVEFSWGATEVKPPELCDAIIDVTETGSSLKANNLEIIDVVMESNTKLIANNDAMKDPEKRKKIDQISLLLESALVAMKKVGLMMNVERSKLGQITKLIPALKNPTISELTDQNYVAVNTIIDEDQVREIIPKLKLAGASGIVEYTLNKVVI